MAAAPSSLGTQIREELTCSVCLELFTRPKALPCGHTFCQDCLQDHVGRKVNFQCPNCRQEAKLPRQGVAGLLDSHIVANLCERLQQQAVMPDETRQQRQPKNRCRFHRSEELKVYCKQCQVPVCEQCLEEEHDGHGITTIKKASQEWRNAISEGKNMLESYVHFIRGLRKEEKSLNEQKQKTSNSIIQAYDQMVQELTEHRDQLLSTTEQNHRKNLERIQSERDKVLADINELSAACDQAELEMDQGGVQFLSQETILTVGQYQRKTAPTSIQTQTAIFRPNCTRVLKVGHVMVNSPQTVTIPGPAALPSSNTAARATGHPHGNLRQGEHQSQKVTFGRWGLETGQLTDPTGVAVSDEGEIFVANSGIQRIQVFTLQGTFVRQFPTVVSGEKKMVAHDVAMDGEGNLWVVGDADSDEFAVQYTKDGYMMRKINLPKTTHHRGIAVDIRKNHILVTQTTGDRGNPRVKVKVLRPDGILVRTVTLDQGMKKPQYITVNGDGNIVVSDSDNHRVYVYNKGGQCLLKFGGEGRNEGKLKSPCGISTDRTGNIIVADTGNSRVELFDKTGRFLKHITTEMERPRAVTITRQGQLVVTDTKKHKVTIFPNY